MTQQQIVSDDYAEVTVRRGDGARLFHLVMDDSGPRSCGGRLLVELGSGERVELLDPLSLFREIFDRGEARGRRAKLAGEAGVAATLGLAFK